MSVYRKGIIKGSGLALIALGAAALIFWFGYYRNSAEESGAASNTITNNGSGNNAINVPGSGNTINNNYSPPMAGVQPPVLVIDCKFSSLPNVVPPDGYTPLDLTHLENGAELFRKCRR